MISSSLFTLFLVKSKHKWLQSASSFHHLYGLIPVFQFQLNQLRRTLFYIQQLGYRGCSILFFTPSTSPVLTLSEQLLHKIAKTYRQPCLTYWKGGTFTNWRNLYLKGYKIFGNARKEAFKYLVIKKRSFKHLFKRLFEKKKTDKVFYVQNRFNKLKPRNKNLNSRFLSVNKNGLRANKSFKHIKFLHRFNNNKKTFGSFKKYQKKKKLVSISSCSKKKHLWKDKERKIQNYIDTNINLVFPFRKKKKKKIIIPKYATKIFYLSKKSIFNKKCSFLHAEILTLRKQINFFRGKRLTKKDIHQLKNKILCLKGKKESLKRLKHRWEYFIKKRNSFFNKIRWIKFKVPLLKFTCKNLSVLNFIFKKFNWVDLLYIQNQIIHKKRSILFKKCVFKSQRIFMRLISSLTRYLKYKRLLLKSWENSFLRKNLINRKMVLDEFSYYLKKGLYKSKEKKKLNLYDAYYNKYQYYKYSFVQKKRKIRFQQLKIKWPPRFFNRRRRFFTTTTIFRKNKRFNWSKRRKALKFFFFRILKKKFKRLGLNIKYMQPVFRLKYLKHKIKHNSLQMYYIRHFLFKSLNKKWKKKKKRFSMQYKLRYRLNIYIDKNGQLRYRKKSFCIIKKKPFLSFNRLQLLKELVIKQNYRVVSKLIASTKYKRYYRKLSRFNLYPFCVLKRFKKKYISKVKQKKYLLTYFNLLKRKRCSVEFKINEPRYRKKINFRSKPCKKNLKWVILNLQNRNKRNLGNLYPKNKNSFNGNRYNNFRGKTKKKAFYSYPNYKFKSNVNVFQKQYPNYRLKSNHYNNFNRHKNKSKVVRTIVAGKKGGKWNVLRLRHLYLRIIHKKIKRKYKQLYLKKHREFKIGFFIKRIIQIKKSRKYFRLLRKMRGDTTTSSSFSKLSLRKKRLYILQKFKLLRKYQKISFKQFYLDPTFNYVLRCKIKRILLYFNNAKILKNCNKLFVLTSLLQPQNYKKFYTFLRLNASKHHILYRLYSIIINLYWKSVNHYKAQSLVLDKRVQLLYFIFSKYFKLNRSNDGYIPSYIVKDPVYMQLFQRRFNSIASRYLMNFGKHTFKLDRKWRRCIWILKRRLKSTFFLKRKYYGNVEIALSNWVKRVRALLQKKTISYNSGSSTVLFNKRIICNNRKPNYYRFNIKKLSKLKKKRLPSKMLEYTWFFGHHLKNRLALLRCFYILYEFVYSKKEDSNFLNYFDEVSHYYLRFVFKNFNMNFPVSVYWRSFYFYRGLFQLKMPSTVWYVDPYRNAYSLNELFKIRSTVIGSDKLEYPLTFNIPYKLPFEDNNLIDSAFYSSLVGLSWVVGRRNHITDLIYNING